MNMQSEEDRQRGLYRNEYEHDACGVGMVANLSGEASHEIVVNGMTVLRANSYFASMIKRGAFDLAVIMLGTNDLVGGTSAEETAERMDAFLDFVQNAGKPVLLISPPHLQYGDWVLDGEQIEESLELGELYRELADKYGFSFADAGEWDIDIAYDGVHFSPEGHAAFAEKLKEVLAHMFADQRS